MNTMNVHILELSALCLVEQTLYQILHSKNAKDELILSEMERNQLLAALDKVQAARAQGQIRLVPN